MKELNKKEKLEKILYLVKKYEISAYSIHKNTKLSEAGIGKILNNISKNPHFNTINTIYNYVITFENNDLENEALQIAEEASLYYDPTTIDISATKEAQKKEALPAFEKMLTDVEKLIKKYENQDQTLAVISHLKHAHLLRLDILKDIDSLKR